MNVKKVLSLLLALSLAVSALAACDNSGDTPAPPSTTTTGTTTNETPSTTTGGDSVDTPVDTPAATGGERDPYTFTYYFNYDWQSIRPWGGDHTSAFWQQKFNITAETSRPDGNPEELLNLRITSNDLPDAIWMERGAVNTRMARMGLFVDLDTLKPMLDNNWYDDNILPQTQEHLKIDGKLYGIPNWARKDASGGNEAWLYTQEIYEAAGSPTIMTFEDLYNYAVYVRDNVPTTSEGLDVIPVGSEDGSQVVPGSQMVNTFYRSMGGPHTEGSQMYGRVGNDFQFLLRDPVYVEAILEANKWFREGLIRPFNVTDSREQFLEKLTTARFGLVWYDHSFDDGNNYRKSLRANYPGNSIEIITMDAGGPHLYLYPPANGLPHSKIYGYHYNTLGWNVTCITTAAQKPERIFELISYWLTKEGSIEMMYGPQGGFFWDEKDADGNPILKGNPDDYPDEVESHALWYYAFAGHADNVDSTKFAANDALPEGNRSWVVSSQAHIFTPTMRPLTDEYVGITQTAIEPDTPLAVTRILLEDRWREELPKIMLAPTAEEAQRMIDEYLSFMDSNGMADVEAVYNVMYHENLSKQGGTIYNR